MIACEIFQNCLDIRRICSSALLICYIADSRIDGYFEPSLKPWNYAAASLILAEAGGKVTDFTNCDVQFAQPTSIIATNSLIHDDISRIVQNNFD